MGIIVQKYGGKLVADKEKMQQVALNIINCYKNGNKVIAVISAIGNTTNVLNEEIFRISNKPAPRDIDMVLATGEQVAVALLSMIIQDMGYKSIGLSGWQAGIITDSNYTNANIINIKKDMIKEYLDNDYIVLIAGFQGIDKDRNITTLGRGGSDTTATNIAVYLDAEKCEIYKDTKCICTADPKIVANAKRLLFISYEQMLELSYMGAKVLSAKSIEYARKKQA